MRPLVMGVLNVTPDSFYDGGRYLDEVTAVERGLAMVAEGADVVDVGGESSRPGADPVDERDELARAVPVVAALAPHVRVSIDTAKAAVARAAVAEGASLVNDVGGGLAAVAAETGAGLVVMHRKGGSKDMQHDPRYGDVVGEVHAHLAAEARRARSLGVGEVYVDPGIGFGKTAAHNLALLAALPKLVAAGEPVLVGASRKGFLGRLAALPGEPPLPPGDRLPGSIAVAVWAALAGVRVLRVHDVAATRQATALVGERAGSLCVAGAAAPQRPGATGEPAFAAPGGAR